MFQRMMPAAKVVLQILPILCRRSLERSLVAIVAVVNQDKIGFVGLAAADINLPWYDMDVFQADDFETVFVGILAVVVVRYPGALGAPVIERIVAAGFFLVFLGEVGLPSQFLDRLIENRPRLAGIVGAVHVDGVHTGRGVMG